MANVNKRTDDPSSHAPNHPDVRRLHDDTDLDPAAFLKSVRELSEKREREDAERVRKLEEEIQKGREERAARRADRARSILPEKQSVVSTPTTRALSRANTNATRVSSPPVTTTPPASSNEPRNISTDAANMEPEKEATPGAGDVPEFKGFGSIKRSSTASSARSSAVSTQDTPTQSASNLARSGTLSWQQRRTPGSKLGGSRPQSLVATETKTTSGSAPGDESEPSRDQIAASLGAREPSWFKQTADRGIGNAAYRKSRDEAGRAESPFSGRRGLPGMSRESSIEPESQGSPPTSASIRSDLVSRGGSARDSTFSNGSRYSATSSSSNNKPDLTPLITADEDQQRASPAFDQASTTSGDSGSLGRTMTMSSSQARITNASDRPASPTKGMGGFVQSAMMRRTDSQNKRWSAQPSASLSRGNSVASTRSGFGGLQGSHSMPKLEPTPGSRDGSDEPTSRPNSSSNDLTGLVNNASQDSDGFVKPALPHHSRSKSVASNYSTNDDGGVPQSPGSPSKRFSPNKSSWIESSLLTKPESPKPAASKNSQPSWMADLAKAKAQRASVDMSSAVKSTGEEGSRPPSRPGSPTKSTPFGPALIKRSESRDLRRRTPQSSTSTTNLRSLRLADKFTSAPAEPLPSSGAEVAEASDGLKPNEASAPERDQEKSELRPGKAEVEASESKAARSDEPKAPAMSANGDSAKSESWGVRTGRSHTLKSPLPQKSKPDTPPKPPTDFRGQLKSRPPPDAKQGDQPEFLSKFGNLRKTHQEKYVAPDVLKDNILRGKSGLAVTDGPVKTARRDELKESLLAKKDDIKKAIQEGRELPGQAHERKTSSGLPQAPAKPEALAKRELLGRSDSARSVQAIEKSTEATPEALSRHKSLKSRSNVDPPNQGTQTPTSLRRNEILETKPEPLKKQHGMAPSESKEPLIRQTSSPKPNEAKQQSETSRLAARFNPNLANLLARGPPSASPSRPESPGTPVRVGSPAINTTVEPPAADEPLQDVRKDRAKGPKRRKGAKADTSNSTAPASTLEPIPKSEVNPHRQAFEQQELTASKSEQQSGANEQAPATKPKPSALPGSAASVMISSLNKSPRPLSIGPYGSEPQQESQSKGETSFSSAKPKPQALPGSAASIMRASLNKSPRPDKDFEEEEKTSTPTRAAFRGAGVVDLQQKPVTPVKSPSLISRTSQDKAPVSDAQASVPEWKGFGASRIQRPSRSSEENKENTDGALPSVKSAASQWGRRPSPQKAESPSQIHLPSKKDEDEVMRSAGLLAASSTGGKNGLGISTDKTGEKSRSTPPVSAGLPPKPTKSSRVVSGQLAEASPNKGLLTVPNSAAEPPKTEAGRALAKTFGTVPKYYDSLAIETRAILSGCNQEVEAEIAKTLRKSVHVISADGTSKPLPPQEEYTLFDESVYVCSHVYTNARGAKNARVFAWTGDAASESAVEAAQAAGRKLAKENGASGVQVSRQGQEPASIFEALGGILITRRGSREGAPKQFMLCGRKHLGHIAFDEVAFSINQLCPGFVYLVSYPVTLQQTKLYLWKGQACSAEELSAARLAAMDLSETGEIIEVDGGVEFASFLKIFGPGTTKWNVPKPSELWQQKATAPDKFGTRLLRIQQAEIKTGLLTSLWNRRPSWNSVSPARSLVDEVKVEAKEISPFTQAQLEADGLYLLDGHSEIFILMGPLFGSQPGKIRDTLLGQTLLFASDYAAMSASMEDRPQIPKCSAVFAGVPRDVKMLFRHWEDSRGLWGTAGLMAGSLLSPGREVKLMPLDEVLAEVCKR
ncbi:hypothetical protein AC579_10025 [Lecanosticta acicola]|uniref:DUF4045 domain-containing protein n=1 Tax=Lecanosticta acicola TaxID=111012 RepID=A0AAI8YTQ7_9PEZI|nr:hypothetical protein AC579_10025 [Lecanosticta acicola]